MVMPDSRTTPWTFVLSEPLRILVVDDDPILREFASVYLSTPSTTIDTACDGVEARTRLSEFSYDIVVLDIEMPRVDGFSLLQEIRSDERLKHLPVVMLTSRDDIASIDRAYQVGATSFATKPVNWRQLSYQILYVIRMSNAQAKNVSSHTASASPNSPTTTSVTAADIDDFLQTIIDRASALEERLTINDRARCSEPLQGLRYFAKRALAEVHRQFHTMTALTTHERPARAMPSGKNS